MRSIYASDDEIIQLGSIANSPHYIYFFNEAIAKFAGVTNILEFIVRVVPQTLNLRGNIKFALAASRSPFQVIHTGEGAFFILVDARALSCLANLCLRVQTLDPIAQHFGWPSVPCEKDYSGKSMLDIAKDIVFLTKDIEPVLNNIKSITIFQSAVTYVIGHEIAHISHGHIEFINSPDFLDFATNDDDRSLTLRTLEMDADSSSTSSTVALFERLFQIWQDDETISEIMWIDTAEKMRDAYCIGIFLSILLLDCFSSDFLPKRYPINYARFIMISDVIELTLLENGVDSKGLTERMRNLLASTFERLSGNPKYLRHPMAYNAVVIDVENEKLLYEYSEHGIKGTTPHVEPLLGRWAKIRPVLEKYQRGGGLAAAQAPPI